VYEKFFKIAAPSDSDVDCYVSIKKLLESIFDIESLSSEREFSNKNPFRIRTKEKKSRREAAQ
jgi:hypothetical protein